MRTTAEERKQRLLADLSDVRRQIVNAASSLSLHQLDEVFLGTWSVKDLLAHLVGWDQANLQAMKDILADELPRFYANHDRDWRTYNAGLVKQHRRDDLGDLLACLTDSHRRLLAQLQTIPPDELERDHGLRFRGWKVTMAKLLRAEAEDEREHLRQIVAFADPSGALSDAAR